MNCEQAQIILLNTTNDAKSAMWIEARNHASQCNECANQVQFEAEIGPWLTTPLLPREEVWTQIQHRTARQAAWKSWTRPTSRKEKMKRNILTTTFAAATLMIAFSLFSPSALASTPKAKFVAMKKAVLAIATKSSAQPSWQVVKGHILEFRTGVSVASSELVDKLSGQGSSATPPTPGQDITIFTLDLDENIYPSFRFGQDHFELILGIKGSTNTRYLIDLDHKTNTPVYAAVQANEKGKWTAKKTWREVKKYPSTPATHRD